MTELERLEVDLATRIENPYWETVKDLPGDDITLKYQGRWEPASYPPIDLNRVLRGEYYEKGLHRSALVKKYSWAIPAPETIGWLAEKLHGMRRSELVEIGAGTGYWAWMLAQAGLDVNAYDTHPPSHGWNEWHSPRVEKMSGYTEEERREHRERWEVLNSLYESAKSLGSPMPEPPAFKPLPQQSVREVLVGEPGWEYWPINEAGVEALSLPENEGRVLFLSWPPYETSMGYDVLSAYQGDTLIYIGEGEGGCNADDSFFELLEKKWTHVESGPLVQWSGLHDYLDLYVRKT